MSSSCVVVEIEGATHFQFLSEASIVDDAICPAGAVDPEGVLDVSVAAVRVFAKHALAAPSPSWSSWDGEGLATEMKLGVGNATLASMQRRLPAMKPATATVRVYAAAAAADADADGVS